jgi:hypothetical protein
MKSDVYKIKAVTSDKLLANILDAAVHTNIHEDQLRRTTCNLYMSSKMQ